MVRTASARPREAAGLRSGSRYVTKLEISDELGSGRELASLSHARTIRNGGWYWISPESEKIRRSVFKGMPTEKGYYKDNHDGTFTKVAHRTDVKWDDRLYVTQQAAANAAKGEGPLTLLVGNADLKNSRMIALTSGKTGYIGYRALVASVPQAKAGEIANAVPEQQLVKAARREFDEQVVKNRRVNPNEFAAMLALLEAAERR